MNGDRLLVSGYCLLTACNLSPLTNRIAVGNEPFVIAVGEGADAHTDLFAASANGGSFHRLSFNRSIERGPRLAPDGVRVAFLRRPDESAPWSLVFLDLQNSAEHSLPLPPEAGTPARLGWSRDGRSVIVRARDYYETAAPPAELGWSRLSPESARADSTIGELLGEPPSAMIRDCPDGTACIDASGELTFLGPGVTAAVRWGGDSVGYFRNGEFEVRPLAGGRARHPGWKALPSRLRELTYHPGQVTIRSGVSGRR